MTGSEVRIVRAIEPDDRRLWVATWEDWPAREVFAHPAYVELFAEQDDVAAAAIAVLDGKTILYPFVIRHLKTQSFWDESCGDCVDLTSAYGYSGPYWWGEGDAVLAADAFWAAFDEWGRQHRAVSEFVRFDLHPERLVPYPGTTQPRLTNVIRTVDLAPDELWMDFAHKVRKNVTRARKSQLAVIRDDRGEHLDDFFRVYRGTMENRGATAEYLFSRAWFERLVDRLLGQFTFFHVWQGDRIVSSELVLVSADYVYSFLGGTDLSARPTRPNDLLKYEVMLWAHETGKRAFVLGGGIEEGDGIFRYKLSFAPHGTHTFSVGMRILDRPRYEALCRRAEISRRGAPAKPSYFPAYRSPTTQA